MSRPAHTLHLRNKDLWPSVIQAGPVTIQFQTGRHGKRVKVLSKGPRLRHKPIVKSAVVKGGKVLHRGHGRA